MEVNTMQDFWQKKWLFSILDFDLKRPKKIPKEPQEALIRTIEFCILDGTKHNPKNFGIIHSIIPK